MLRKALHGSFKTQRLQNYVDSFDIIEPCQTGFRKGFATMDNIFILLNLIDIIGKSNKKLYCAFIGLKQAFERVWHNGLWHKLNNYNINGKYLRVIQSMHRNMKSCVIANGSTSSFFISNVGVRQGEYISPILLNLFLNDLEHFFRDNNVNGIECTQHRLDDDIFVYAIHFAIMYADDTVIMSDTSVNAGS